METVEKYFSFLIHEYNFSVTEEMSYPNNPIAQGKIIYLSRLRQEGTGRRQVIVRVLIDRGYLSVDIGSSDLDSKDYFDLHEIMRVIAPDTDMDFSLDFSKHPKDIIEPQAKKLSELVMIHCESFLNGDFSIGDTIINARMEERERRLQRWKEERRQKDLLS